MSTCLSMFGADHDNDSEGRRASEKKVTMIQNNCNGQGMR